MTEKRFEMVIEDTQGNFYYLDKKTGEKIKSTLVLEDKLNELYRENKELQDTIETICEDFEVSHGMDIRNADWFTAW